MEQKYSSHVVRTYSLTDIVKNLSKIFRDKDFKKYARRNKMSLNDIKIADNWARLKTVSLCVK